MRKGHVLIPSHLAEILHRLLVPSIVPKMVHISIIRILTRSYTPSVRVFPPVLLILYVEFVAQHDLKVARHLFERRVAEIL